MRLTRLTTVFLLLAMVLAGCTSIKEWAGLAEPVSGEVRYHNPNYSPELWAHDSYECEREARQPGRFDETKGVAGAMELRQAEDRCLNARGWTVTMAETK